MDDSKKRASKRKSRRSERPKDPPPSCSDDHRNEESNSEENLASSLAERKSRALCIRHKEKAQRELERAAAKPPPSILERRSRSMATVKQREILNRTPWKQ